MNPGRNDGYPCGSQRRYKLCCGRLADGPAVRQISPAPTQGMQRDVLARLSGLLDAGCYAELESAAAELLDGQPQSALLWQLLGVARARQDRDPLHALAMAVQCAPDDAAAHLNLGNAFARLGRLDEAAGSYRRALDADPEFADAHNNLGELWLERGRADLSNIESSVMRIIWRVVTRKVCD
jgi:tetratricopeptide (TPR) repeat protein